MNAQNEDTTDNDEVETPEIDKVEATFRMDDTIRTNRRGESFNAMQDEEIEFEIDNYDKDNIENRVKIWFDNETHLEYWHRDENTIEERTYDEEGELHDSVDTTEYYIEGGEGSHEIFVGAVEDCLDAYFGFDTLDDLHQSWINVWEIAKRENTIE